MAAGILYQVQVSLTTVWYHICTGFGSRIAWSTCEQSPGVLAQMYRVAGEHSAHVIHSQFPLCKLYKSLFLSGSLLTLAVLAGGD